MSGAARKGDPGALHCSTWTIASASSDVQINGRGAARIGDSTSVHLKPSGRFCFPHTATITQGAATVFINGRPAARIGSQLAGCTRVIGGSGDVDIGGPSVGSGSGLAFQALSFAASFALPSLSELGGLVSEGASLGDIAELVADGAFVTNPLDTVTSVLESAAGVVTAGGAEVLAAPIDVAVAVPTGN